MRVREGMVLSVRVSWPLSPQTCGLGACEEPQNTGVKQAQAPLVTAKPRGARKGWPLFSAV